ncbi:antigen peptide transporter 2-like [Empidonax traillii]|uniref:antigen peptide transporter 2-like n=1 Tax=Empidonax traillii TaxID=164674 RepID=UPI000FFDA145|nr:antigen peptide transporter 2-like [Empidonax traillii]
MALPPSLLLLGALLVADALSLSLLGPLVPALARLGPAGAWLEAALRLPLLAAAPRLLSPLCPPGATTTAAVATIAVTPAAFTALRSLLGLPGPGPGLLAAAAPAWLGVTHAAAALALLAWDAPRALGGVPKAPGGVPEVPGGIWRVLALTCSEWKVLGAAFLCLMVAAAAETAGPYVTGKVLDAVRSGNGLTTGAVGMVVAAEAASVLFSGCRGWLFLLAAARLRQSLRLRLFSHLLHQDLDFFQGMPAAELSARFSAEVPLVSMAVPRGTNLLLRSLGMALVEGAAMVRLAPGLALLALLELPLGITAQRIHSARRRTLVGPWNRGGDTTIGVGPWNRGGDTTIGVGLWNRGRDTKELGKLTGSGPGQVVLVEQDPILFSGTIRENVVLGLEGCEESELREAAAAAGALEFIQGLEQGWDTEVGERGGQLAAGERRRLALARALLRRPTVLILDEALDEGDEGAVSGVGT